MSNTFALTAVTASMTHLLKQVTNVTNERPSEATESGQRLNLFLYRVTPNPAMRNADLPFRNGRGDVVHQPVLALNLHYLLTAFGKSPADEFDAQRVLSHAMSVLHDNAQLTRNQIRTAMTAFNSYPELQGADLADQLETVKLTPAMMSHEEHFRLWDSFQVPYRLSVVYEASVVLVERPRQAKAAPPVRSALVGAVGLGRPRIDALEPQILETGVALTIRGRELAGDSVKVVFATGEIDPVAVAQHEIQVMPPAGLRAGMQRVQVVQRIPMGRPPTLHRGFESNAAAFMRAPRITTAPPYKVKLGTPAVPADADLALALAPPVARSQNVLLVVGDRTIPRKPPAPPTQAETANVTFTVPRDFPLGTHLLRVQVDGAESALTVDPNTEQYVGPTLEVTQ